MKRVVVIGGGFAGLAAGVALAGRGLGVDVLEARGRLGGRAYSFRDDESGAVVDNGQHAMMGCYAHTLAFLERIGCGGKLFRQRNLFVRMIHPQRGSGAIACPSLPGPLHILGGILGYRLLGRDERLAALLAGLRLMAMRTRHDPRLESATVEEVLVGLGQSAPARAAFWDPIAIATLNESPARAAAAPFVEVLARAFFRSRRASQFVLPRVGLSELYTEDARHFIEARGGRVATGATVVGLAVADGRVAGLELRDGSRVAAAACISALPPRALAAIVPDALRQQLALDGFDTTPIVSTHLWFDRPVLADTFVGMLETSTQWLFDRSRLLDEGGEEGGQFVSAVMSAGREPAGWDTARVADTVVAEMRALIPAARAARVRRAVVVKEKQATVSPTPAAERLRPAPETPLRNFLLAGDWTATGLPPTIESAVSSGERAAALAAAQLGAGP